MKDGKIHNLPIREIWRDDQFNCRTSISQESVESLAATIDEMDRLLMPVIVQPGEEVEDIPNGFKYKLICGFRRTLAVGMLGWEYIPCVIHEGLSEHDLQLMNLTENLERKNLNIFEEATAIDKLFPLSRPVSSIASEIKRTVSWVTLRRNLLTLPEFVQRAAASSRLTQTDLQHILADDNPPLKAQRILDASRKGRKYKRKVLFGNTAHPRNKDEVKELITTLLQEGFNPNLVRMLGWVIGQVDDDGLKKSLEWIRDRRGWLK